MSNILVFLPKEFNCYSKLERKLSRITSTFNQFELCCPQDINSLVTQFSQNNNNCRKIEINSNWEDLKYTHVVIFDDGEVFPNEIQFFKEKNIPLRIISIKITRVINIHHHPKFQSIKNFHLSSTKSIGILLGHSYCFPFSFIIIYPL